MWVLSSVLYACTSSPSSPVAAHLDGGPQDGGEVVGRDGSVRGGAQKPDASEASPVDAAGEVDASIDGGEDCIEKTVVVRPLGADLYIMLDRSGSMSESTA